MKDAARDLLPIVLVIVVFQIGILQKPFPNLGSVLIGMFMVLLGLTFFVRGLEMGLFPMGESVAHALARKGSLFWLFSFSFALGFSTTIAEPALIAIANKAASVAATAGAIGADASAQESYAYGLRISVALSVGFAIMLGVWRILKGWPIQKVIMVGYLVVVVFTVLAPVEIIGLAYDSGGVTTSTVTVPLVTALGVGLASSISGRNPLIDGFGLIALASLLPMIFVMGYGILVFGFSG